MCAGNQNEMVLLLTFASNLKPSTATASAFWSLLLLCTKLDFETCISIRGNSGCQHQFADDDDDDKRKEKEDRGQSFGHFSTCGQSFPLVGRLENDLLQDLENDILQRMIF